MSRRRPVPESAVQQAIIETLLYDGWLVIRVNSGAARFAEQSGDDKRFVRFVRWQDVGFGEDSAGVADVLAFKDGRGLLIEVKAPGGRVRLSQERFLAAAKQVGATWVVAESVEDLRPFLDRVEV